jgi:hypothetical protein
MAAGSVEGRSKSQQLYWLLQVLGWSLYTLLRIAAAVSVLPISWVTATIEITVLDIVGLWLSHGLRGYVRRHHWSELSIPQLIPRIATVGLILGVPLGIATQLSSVADLQDPRPLLDELVPHLGAAFTLPIRYGLQIVNWAVLYMIWLSMYFVAVGLREHRSARLKQSELARALQLAELKLLKSQLNPHFLFNSLNTVRSLIAENPARAQNAVTRLANTLRHTLRQRQDELVTLAQEMVIVDDYLELESMRFEHKLTIEKVLPAEATELLVPVMLLQTLVENAIKHGIAEMPAGGVLSIHAALEGDALMVEISNPRPPVKLRQSDHGVGLRNARERLRLLFGDRAHLDLDLSNPGFATARLRVPRHP